MTLAPLPHGFRSEIVPTGAISLHVATTGTGEPIVFLHGFPEHWRAFAPFMTAMAGEYRCIAPDLRGIGLSDRPRGEEHYYLDALADDVAGLITALNYPHVRIVAHDWGGLIAWHLASRHPSLIKSMVIFNAPHPFCFQRALDIDPAQRAASLYAAQFARDGSHLAFEAQDPSQVWDKFFAHDAVRGALSSRDKTAQIAAWSHPGAWEASLNYYRAAGFDYSGTPTTRHPAPTPIPAPVLVVHGAKDTIFSSTAFEALDQVAVNCRVIELEEGGHCAFRDNLDYCVELVRDFFQMPQANTHV